MRIRLFYIFILCCLVTGCNNDPMSRMPNFPMLLPDNGGLLYTDNLSRDSSIMFVHFDPDCKGCQEEAALIKEKKEVFKNVRIYFLSVKEWKDIRFFREYFKLGEHSNIRFGRDIDTALVRHFKTPITPLIALYNRSRELKAVIEGNSDLSKLMDTIEEIQ